MSSVRLLATLGLLLIGCSNVVASGPSVYGAGEIEWGARADQRFHWELQETFNLVDAVSLVSTYESGKFTSVASRRSVDDVMWWRCVVPMPDAPSLVFGGALSDIDSVMILHEGEEIEVQLASVVDRDWRVGLVELPRRWAGACNGELEIVGFSGEVEAQRSMF